MKSQTKVKGLILLAITIMVALFVIVGVQLFNIIKIKKEINAQQQTISELQQQIDHYEKTPSGEHENIIGENK